MTRKSSKIELLGAHNASAKPPSIVANNMGNSKPSLVPDSGAIDVEAAIALLQELKKNASPEDLVALHKALLPTKEVEQVQSPTVSESEEAFGNRASLSRRRSVLPPGLATRGGAQQDILRRPLPLTPKQPVPVYPKMSRPQSEQDLGGWALATEDARQHRFAALDLAEDASNASRAVTPSQMAYSHIGALKLGSLHITNGRASPDPSVALSITERTSSLDLQDGYMTASEGRPSIDMPRVSTDSNVPIRERILNSARASQNSLTSVRAARASEKDARVLSNKSSRLNLERGADSSDDEYQSPRSISAGQPRLQHRASSIAQDYISDCDLNQSPFVQAKDLREKPSSEKASSWRGHKDARASRLEIVADLEDAPADKATGGTQEALRELNNATSRASLCPLPQAQPSQCLSSNVNSLSPDKQRPHSVAKTDSGYNSETSLQSLTKQAIARSQREGGDDLLLGPPKQSVVNTIVEDAENEEDNNLYTFEEMIASERSSVDAHTLSSEPRTCMSEPRKLMSKHSLLQVIRPNLSMKRSSMPVMGSVPTRPSTDSIPTIASTQSSPAQAASIERTSPKMQKKLQKTRPVSYQAMPALVTVQSVQDIKVESIPVVPEATSVNFSRRLIQAPAMGHLERTYASVSHTESEALRESPTDYDVLIRFPSISSQASKPEKRGSRRSRSRSRKSRVISAEVEKSASERSGRFAAFRSRSRSKSQKRASTDSQIYTEHDALPVFTDFGTVAESLGSSPYDIATTCRPSVDVPGGRIQFHPYQIGNALARTKSGLGMNEQAATELARMRSQDRVEDMQYPAVHSRSVHGQHNDQHHRHTRQRSHSPAAARSAPPARPGLPNRPHSMYAESIPPIPDLPCEAAPRSPERLERTILHRSQTMPAPTPIVTHAPISTRPSHNLSPSPERTPVTEGEAAGNSPTHEAMHLGWPGWETQARLWRERRLLLPDVEVAQTSPAKRPEIVVSRYVTPLTAELAVRNDIVPTALLDAVDFTPIKPQEEPRPAKSDVPRFASAPPSKTDNFSTATPHVSTTAYAVDENESPKANLSRPQSATPSDNGTFRSAKSDTSPASPSAPAPTPLRKSLYHPYRKADGTETARSASPAYFTTKPSTPFSSPAASPAPRPGSKLPTNGHIVEQLRRSLEKMDTQNNATPPEACDGSRSRERPAIVDRYSGGLGYEWERGAGFGGSAGTRARDDRASRKSLKLSEDWGVDLSDVPVFLMRVE
ncbi:hypothetical protein LTR28_011838 [Elasticomyces elasticus]|nr:hypothetical protein LTR28_011838 [Elasticomyces elasticus]